MLISALLMPWAAQDGGGAVEGDAFQVAAEVEGDLAVAAADRLPSMLMSAIDGFFASQALMVAAAGGSSALNSSA